MTIFLKYSSTPNGFYNIIKEDYYFGNLIVSYKFMIGQIYLKGSSMIYECSYN